MKEFKLKFDRIFDENKTPRVDTPRKNVAPRIPLDVKVPNLELKRAQSKVLSPVKRRILTETRLRSQFSADDIDKMVTPLKEPDQNQSIAEDNLCYICYENAPNAVLMGCGHGGVCYECALELVKKNKNCMECRGEIDTVYKIDPNRKFFDIITAQESSKIAKGNE